MDGLTKLPNIGETLAEELRDAGVDDEQELKRLGSIEAALRIDRGGRDACHSMLCALEGAIRGVRWHSIPKPERQALCDEYDRRYEQRQEEGKAGGSW